MFQCQIIGLDLLINSSTVISFVLLNQHKIIILFIKLANEQTISENLKLLISSNIRDKLSRRHVPSHIIQVSDIPKTRSGKIAELTIRDIINGNPIKNIEALANPDCLEQYENIAEIKK